MTRHACVRRERRGEEVKVAPPHGIGEGETYLRDGLTVESYKTKLNKKEQPKKDILTPEWKTITNIKRKNSV